MKSTDINDRKKNWIRFKENDKQGIQGISKHNSNLILNFINDYELGYNVGSFKGRRTPATLTKLRHQLIFFAKQLNKDLDKITKNDLHKLFFEMEEGKLTKLGGARYLGVGEFVKGAKSFYGWLMRTDKLIKNPTSDLSISFSNGSGRKPNWVYLGNENMKELINQARGDYRAIIMFLYDGGLRPQEAWRIRINDFSDDYTTLEVPEVRNENKERVSKTFARKIKLIKCPTLVKEYIKINKLSGEDLLITFQQRAFNDYVGRLAKKLFGNEPTKARGKPSQFKSYDIRHNSACYFLGKYRRNSDLMKRFGWKKEDKIFYYTEFLGKGDNIEEDMITEEDKNKYEKELAELRKEIEVRDNQLDDKWEDAVEKMEKRTLELIEQKTKGIMPKQYIKDKKGNWEVKK